MIKRTVPNRNRGAALASALILLVSLTLIAVTMAYRSTMDELMAANQRDALNAMAIADSGIEAAFAEVKNNSDYSLLGQALLDLCDNGTFKQSNLSGGSYTVTITNCVTDPTNALYPRVVLHSVGTVNGAERVAETLLKLETGGGGGNWPSFIANDYIEVSDPNLFGDIIHIHSNYRIKVSGAPEICTGFGACDPDAEGIAGTISASGLEAAVINELVAAYREGRSPSLDSATLSAYAWFDASLLFDGDANTNPYDNWPVENWADYWFGNAYDPKTYEAETKNPYPWDVTGYPVGEDASGSAPIEIPHIYPPDWQQYATVELTADCQVVGGLASGNPGALIHDVSSQGVWNGWSCTGSAWEMKSSSASMHSGFFYVHGNIKISATVPNPWQASFVTAGNIEIGCCTEFLPYGQTGNDAADKIFLLAGNDIQVFGSPSEPQEEGVIAAHGNVKLSGSDSYFKGTVIAESYLYAPGQEVVTNVQDIKNPTSINLINSNVWLNGTGVGLGGGGGAPQLVAAAWRELVH